MDVWREGEEERVSQRERERERWRSVKFIHLI